MQRDRDPNEERMAEIHRVIATRIRREPNVIAESKDRLLRIIEREPPPADPVLCEWRDLLLMAEPHQIADFIESRTPRARRLRSSSPLLWLAR